MGKDRFITVTKKEVKVTYPLTTTISSSFYHPKKEEWTKFVSATKEFEFKKLKILTFNVLFDFYDTELIHSEKRYPRVLKAIEESNADVIGLQEVTKTFLDLLLKEPWVRKKYLVSDVTGSTIDPYGVLCLSKVPIDSMIVYKFKENAKPILIVNYLLYNETVSFGIVHLPSDKGKDVEKKRAAQILDTFHKTKYSAHSFVMGDFNFGDGEENESTEWGDYKDVWKILESGRGFTYDPDTNLTAKITSQKMIPKRLDRVMMRSKSFKPLNIEIVATESFKVETKDKDILLHPSDHYGLLCTIQLKE